jgi:hypothetical protein
MVLFKNLTDVSQIMALAHQMYPRRTQFFLEAFAQATARPHGYMVIAMKQNTPDILRLRTFIVLEGIPKIHLSVRSLSSF